MADDERRVNHDMREVIERVADQAALKAATNAVPQAVVATLKSLGMDASDPLTIQKNMAFLNESRLRCEKFYSDMWGRMVNTAMTILKYLIIVGIVATLARLGLQIDGGLLGWGK